MLVSYAQNFEDVMLWRTLGHIENGRYIDIGAQDPLVDSVSLMFYEHGWRGIHVEPTLSYAEQLRQARPDELVIQAAVAAKNGVMRFYEFPDTGLSTGVRKIAKKHINSGVGGREIVVPGITLDEVFSRESGEEVHWLKIDVEGTEEQVLRGWVHSALRPWVILIESTLPLSQVPSHKRWESLVLRKGYKFVYFDGLNRFYIANGHAELVKAFISGPNVFDGFTLSGTASSSLCTTLNSRIRSLEEQRERERQEAEGRLTLLRGELSEQLRVLQTEAERVAKVSAIEQKELHGRLHASHARLAELSQTLTDREREFNDRLQALQQQTLAASAQLALREKELSAQLVEFQAAAASEARTLAEKQHDLIVQLHASQAEAVRLGRGLSQREKELTEELQSSKAEAERLGTLLAGRELEFAEQLKIWQREALLSTQGLAARERELGAQLVENQAEASRTAHTLATQASALSAQLLASQQQTEAISQHLVAREQELVQQLDRNNKETNRLITRERELVEHLGSRDREATLAEQRHITQVQGLTERLHAAELREQELARDIREQQAELVRAEQARANLELQLNEQLRVERETRDREATLSEQRHIAQVQELAERLHATELRERELAHDIREQQAELIRREQAHANLGLQLNEQLRVEREINDREATLAKQRHIAQVQEFTERLHAAELREQDLARDIHAQQAELVRAEQGRANLEVQLNEQLRVEREINDREATLAKQRHIAQVQELAERLHAAELREQERAHDIREQQAELVRAEQTRANLEVQLNEQLRVERETNCQLQRELRSLRDELAGTRNALSWRLTAPFRTVAGWLYPAHFRASVSYSTFHRAPGDNNIEAIKDHGATSENINMADNFSEHAIQPSQINTATTLQALLQHQDRSFVECAYLTLLRRRPDPTGRDYYTGRLRAGVPKIQILDEIFRSSEALSKAVVLPGLGDAVRKYKLGQLPLIGNFFRRIFAIEGNSMSESRLRSLEQQIFLFIQKSDVRFERIERIERGLEHLQTLIVQQAQLLESLKQWGPEKSFVVEAQEYATNNTALEEQPAAVDEFPSSAFNYMKLGTIASESGDALSAMLTAVNQWPLGRRAIE